MFNNSNYFSQSVSHVKGETVNRIAFLLLAGYVWILPIAHTTTIRQVFLFSLLFLTLWAAWRRDIKLYMPMLSAWLIYAAIAGVSLFYSIDPVYSLREIKNEIGYSILSILIAASLIKNLSLLTRLVWVLIIGNTFLVFYAAASGLYIYISSDFLLKQNAPFNIGVGKFSSYILITIPFIAAQALVFLKSDLRVSFVLLLLMFANFIALFFTINRISWYAIAIELILMLGLLRYYRVNIGQWKLIAVSVVFLLTVALALNLIAFTHRSGYSDAESATENTFVSKAMESLSTDPRGDLWRVTVKNINDKPLSGGGFGREAFKMLNPEYPKTHSLMWHAHNMFLNKGVQMGYPGILAFSMLFVFALRKMKLRRNLVSENYDSFVYSAAGIAMVAGTVIKNLTDDLFVRDNGWLFWVMTAAVIAALRKGKIHKDL